MYDIRVSVKDMVAFRSYFLEYLEGVSVLWYASYCSPWRVLGRQTGDISLVIFHFYDLHVPFGYSVVRAGQSRGIEAMTKKIWSPYVVD